MPTEIVVIDQSEEPHPKLPTLARQMNGTLRYIRSDEVGVSAARNLAIAETRHDIFVLIDDDMRVAPEWFGTLVRALITAGPESVISGRVLPAQYGDVDGFAPSTRVDEEPVIYRGRLDRDVLYTGNMAMWRHMTDNVGLFDIRLGVGAEFPAATDNDFGFRLLEAGYQIVYVPQAAVYHYAWRPKSQMLRHYWRYGIGQGGFYAKHLRRHPHIRRRIGSTLRYYLLGAPSRMRRHRDEALADLAYGIGVIRGLIHWLLKYGSS